MADARHGAASGIVVPQASVLGPAKLEFSHNNSVRATEAHNANAAPPSINKRR